MALAFCDFLFYGVMYKYTFLLTYFTWLTPILILTLNVAEKADVVFTHTCFISFSPPYIQITDLYL